MTDLLQEKNSLVRQLSASVKKLRETGTDYAEKERDYKVLVSQECIRLRGEGMAVSMINLVIYGLPNVAQARFERDVALTIYEANKEAINSLKLKLRLIEGQMSREWNSGNEV